MNKITVTIGITAYNEARNISQLLSSIAIQRATNYSLQQILLICDKCTDNTAQLARAFRNRKLKVVETKTRQGQNACLNIILSQNRSDILVLIDADMVLKGTVALATMVEPFLNDSNVGLVTANTLPLPAQNFLEDSINNYVIARNELQRKFDFGNTLFVAHGFLAYSKSFLKHFTLPAEVLNHDAFSYLACIKAGWNHVYRPRCIAWYRSVSTLPDHLRQSERHRVGGLQLYNYFDAALIQTHMHIPMYINLLLLKYQLIHNPIGYLLLKTLNMYCMNLAKRKTKNYSNIWAPITTSKSLI